MSSDNDNDHNDPNGDDDDVRDDDDEHDEHVVVIVIVVVVLSPGSRVRPRAKRPWSSGSRRARLNPRVENAHVD